MNQKEAIHALAAKPDGRWWMYEYNMFYEEDTPEWRFGFFKVHKHGPAADWEDYPLPQRFDIV